MKYTIIKHLKDNILIVIAGVLVLIAILYLVFVGTETREESIEKKEDTKEIVVEEGVSSRGNPADVLISNIEEVAQPQPVKVKTVVAQPPVYPTVRLEQKAVILTNIETQVGHIRNTLHRYTLTDSEEVAVRDVLTALDISVHQTRVTLGISQPALTREEQIEQIQAQILRIEAEISKILEEEDTVPNDAQAHASKRAYGYLVGDTYTSRVVVPAGHSRRVDIQERRFGF